MTNERAIELLQRISDSQFDGEYGDERREALEKAVRALESNLVKGSDGLVNDLVKDCISRQQAIDALDKHIDTFDAIDTNYLCGLRTAMSILKEMPSAQPETHDKRTETHECDLINRQQAIDAVVSAMIDGADAELVEGVMELLPSAQPERKNGKWIKISPANIYECSECGKNVMTDDISAYDFCHGCGADMRTEGNNDN